MGETVYVVVEHGGGYDSYESAPVAVFDSEAEATAHAERLEAEEDARAAKWTDYQRSFRDHYDVASVPMQRGTPSEFSS